MREDKKAKEKLKNKRKPNREQVEQTFKKHIKKSKETN